VSVAREDAAEPYITDFWPGNTYPLAVTTATIVGEPPTTSLLMQCHSRLLAVILSKYAVWAGQVFLELHSILAGICINLLP
jgi:hypothetical protein